ncbi:hypothetical protein BU23DRAFT_508906 [Bimuria novae-zelandiae CBS 107.79]|uniref:Transposase Tc1-like domain-containing protein n=1 Tax=Bimuria novae-zelandiae CBS 107.79 TaxID=1447943 RepID=A0A6A5V677_9PLEO|nr:hypothetical protein BU23DRAFT_508906 [Bimuria novae-zelandiae CBS 107.79]
MPQTNRRKPFPYKARKSRVNKTEREEMAPLKRAFAVGAAVLGGASQISVAKELEIDQGNLSRLISRLKSRSEALKLPLWDPSLYENDIGRGRPELLDQSQKDLIIKIVTSDREHREKEAWQAIADGYFEERGLPKMSITTFQNVMYEAGYSRKAQGFKPTLTDDQHKERYEWALAHNSDKDEYGDGKGFNYRRVVYTDETPARVGEQRGMKRAWCKADEVYHKDVKRPKIQANYCTLQFYGSFTYDYKGPTHIYEKETPEQKREAQKALEAENQENRRQREELVPLARRALRSMGDSEVNSKKHSWTKKTRAQER